MSSYKTLLAVCLLSTLTFNSYSQVDSPYETSLLKDGTWLATTIGLNAYGLSRIKNKEPLSIEDLNKLDKNDIWFVDRWSAGNYDTEAYRISDIGFITSFGTPLLLALDKDTRSHSGQLSIMMIESLSTASALFTISAGVIDKSRPKVYNENLDTDTRVSNNSQRSFFSGHVASSAAATFFAAKVFNDFFPKSKYKVLVWAGAATIPAVVGYFRIKAGEHFLSDVIIGYIVGAASGILVPTLHKKKNQNINITTGIGFKYQTIGVNYQF